jgi:hypothetical protein
MDSRTVSWVDDDEDIDSVVVPLPELSAPPAWSPGRRAHNEPHDFGDDTDVFEEVRALVGTKNLAQFSPKRVFFSFFFSFHCCCDDRACSRPGTDKATATRRDPTNIFDKQRQSINNQTNK